MSMCPSFSAIVDRFFLPLLHSLKPKVASFKSWGEKQECQAILLFFFANLSGVLPKTSQSPTLPPPRVCQ